MRFVLGFAPFAACAIMDRLLGSTSGLIAGAVVSLALIIRDVSVARRSPKILEIGTMVLLGGLALYALAAAPRWSIIEVRLYVDTGLSVIVLATMAIGRPFTLQYAREQVGEAQAASPRFLRTNYLITGIWALAFAVMAAGEATLLERPDIPRTIGGVAIAAALGGAFIFSRWYPRHVASRATLE